MTVIFRMDFHITSLAFWHFPMIRFLLNNQTHVFRRIFWETSREKSLKVSVKSEVHQSPTSVHGQGFKAGVGTRKDPDTDRFWCLWFFRRTKGILLSVATFYSCQTMIRNLQRFLLKPNSILTETTLVSIFGYFGSCITDHFLDNETTNGSCLGLLEFTTFQLENFSVLSRQISASWSVHLRFLCMGFSITNFNVY